MSSNQNNTSLKRVSSIRRRLVSKIIGGKIMVCLGHDFCLLILMVCVWMFAVEFTATGNVDLKGRYRCFTSPSSMISEEKADFQRKNFKSLIVNLDKLVVYRVGDDISDEILVEVRCINILMHIITIVSMIFIFQVLCHLIGIPSAYSKVRHILKPIDELAIKADELSRYDFSEDKYHIIEETIDNIEPDDEKISLGDKDLAGIELAMNNMIERIRRSNRQQARFVNDASHELRTPIAVIQGYANMLARWGKEDEKVLDESIDAIKNETDNMQHLVEQLLFLARGDAGRTIVKKEKINVNSLMQEVYEESLMIDENHVYKLSVPEDDTVVNADESLLKQAVRILVDNAAKYTNEKDEILLSVGNKGNMAFLQVQDSGIGMKEADVEHMFERFYRADEARSFDGTGLGLSIAKWIVDKHQGHFEIISREGLGTRIAIFLPRA